MGSTDVRWSHTANKPQETFTNGLVQSLQTNGVEKVMPPTLPFLLAYHEFMVIKYILPKKSPKAAQHFALVRVVPHKEGHSGAGLRIPAPPSGVCMEYSALKWDPQ